MAKRRKKVLTPGRERLVKAYSQTGSARIAAKEAGMHVNNAYIALRTPEVQAAVMREQMYILRVQGVPAAVKALIDVASNPKERGSSRAQAAKIILDQAKDQPGGSDKSIDQMTADEMQAQLDEIRSRRAELATVIDAEIIEPNLRTDEGGALD